MAFFRYLFLFRRTSDVWNYQHSLRIETIMTLLWISPVYHVTRTYLTPVHSIEQTVFLVVVWMNM
jgi:hypothetical protein